LTSTEFIMPDLNGTDQSVMVKAVKEITSTGDPGDHGLNGNGASIDSIDSIASSIIEQPDLNYIQVRKGRTSRLRGCYS
jgi:hypothetical protein